MATYYISPSGSDSTGNGSIGSPWATVQKFLDSAASPGDTLYCRGNAGSFTGTGNWNLYIDGIAGTSGNPITITSYPGETATFDGEANGATRRHFACFRDGSNYWVVDGIRLVDFTQDEFGVITIGFDTHTTVTHDITLRNLYIQVGTPYDWGDHGVYIENYVHTVLIEDCEIEGPGVDAGAGAAGIHVYHSPSPYNLTFRRNFIHGFPIGIMVWEADTTATCEWNTLADNIYIHYDFHYHSTLLFRNNVADASASTFFSDPNDSAETTSYNNYPDETLNANGTLQPGSDAIGGAHDGSDAGAFQTSLGFTLDATIKTPGSGNFTLDAVIDNITGGGARLSQATAESLVLSTAPSARLSQATAESLVLSTAPSAFLSQAPLEAIYPFINRPSLANARLSHLPVESLVQPSNASVRLSQAAAETLVRPVGFSVRSSQVVVEVMTHSASTQNALVIWFI